MSDTTSDTTAPPETPESSANSAADFSAASSSSPPPSPDVPPPLQREALVFVPDRGRLGIIVALSTLSGVAAGFLMAMAVVRAPSAETCSSRSWRVRQAPPVAIADASPCQSAQHWRFRSSPQMRLAPSDRRAWLGVSLESADHGVRVSGVIPGSPAASAGIQAGDLIQDIDGESVATVSQVQRAVGGHTAGDSVAIKVQRGQTAVSLLATLALRDGTGSAR